MGDRHDGPRTTPRHRVGEFFVLALLAISLAPAFFLASALAVIVIRQLIFHDDDTIGPFWLTLMIGFSCYATYASVSKRRACSSTPTRRRLQLLWAITPITSLPFPAINLITLRATPFRWI